MKAFGERMGERLADYLKSSPILKDAKDPGACALGCVLEAIRAHLTIEHIGPELRFIVADCPMLEISETTGLREIELAQFGFNVMCQCLIHAIDPGLLFHMPMASDPSQTFTLVKSTLPHLEQAAITYTIPPKEVRVKSEQPLTHFPLRRWRPGQSKPVSRSPGWIP